MNAVVYIYVTDYEKMGQLTEIFFEDVLQQFVVCNNRVCIIAHEDYLNKPTITISF